MTATWAGLASELPTTLMVLFLFLFQVDGFIPKIIINWLVINNCLLFNDKMFYIQY